MNNYSKEWSQYLQGLINQGFHPLIIKKLSSLQVELSILLGKETYPTVGPLVEDNYAGIEASFCLTFCTLIVEFFESDRLDNWCCLFSHPTGKRDYIKTSSDYDEESVESFFRYSLVKIKNLLGLMKVLQHLLINSVPMPSEIILQEGDWYVGPCYAFEWDYNLNKDKFGHFILSYSLEKNEYYFSSLDSSKNKEFYGVLNYENLGEVCSEITFLINKA